MTNEAEPSKLIRTLVCAGVLTTFASAGTLAYESKQQKTNPDYHFSKTIPYLPFKGFLSGLTLIGIGIYSLYRQDKPTISSTIDTSISPEKSKFTLSEWFNSKENRTRIAKEKAQPIAQTYKQKQQL